MVSQRTLMCMILILVPGCDAATTAVRNEEPATPKVGLSLTDPRIATVGAKINITPASPDTAVRLELVGRRLISENKQVGRPNLNAISSPDPEIFHVGMKDIYVTDALVQQCASDGQLAAVLANEMGRMVSEREAAVDPAIRQPPPMPPIDLPIAAAGNTRQEMNEVPVPLFVFHLPTPGANPTGKTFEVAPSYDRMYPKQQPKLSAPNPQMVARSLLERAGYQRTELDGAQAILDNAARFSTVETQFKGTVKQADWKQP